MTVHDYIQEHLGWLAIELAKAKAERDDALAQLTLILQRAERNAALGATHANP